jgi:hypothetical protein
MLILSTSRLRASRDTSRVLDGHTLALGVEEKRHLQRDGLGTRLSCFACLEAIRVIGIFFPTRVVCCLGASTCLMRPRPRLFSCVVRRVKNNHDLPQYSPLLKEICVR